MNGVTILNEIQLGIGDSGWIGILFIGVCLFVAFGLTGLIQADMLAFKICGVGFAIIVAFIIAAYNYEPIVQKQVIIDNTISFAEFTEHYKIIKQDGLIYTVTEKDD